MQIKKNKQILNFYINITIIIDNDSDYDTSEYSTETESETDEDSESDSSTVYRADREPCKLHVCYFLLFCI